jgi:predicted NUDIX family phosphoesterase
MVGEWVKEANLKEFYDNFETWTKIVYDNLIKKKI